MAQLDSSASALAAATNALSIGSSPLYWSTLPSSPSSHTATVGDKVCGSSVTHPAAGPLQIGQAADR
eukprot:4205442-Prymnesium_polylepis.1